MEKLKGLSSLIVIVLVVWGVMRIVHVIVPVMKPEVLPGPFTLESLSEVEPITGFSARLPLYHPERLGRAPATIIASRRPRSEVTIVWRKERFLELIERAEDDEPFEYPDDAVAEGDDPLHLWKRGEIVYLTGTRRGVHLRLRTNLTREDALRVVSTLVPLEEVR